MEPDVEGFFENYAAAYNRSLGDRVDVDAIRACFTDSFIGAGPQGVVTGNNDDTFTETLRKGYEFYKSIGTTHMAVRSVSSQKIDAQHLMATVSYRATYDKDGKAITIDFPVTYLLQHREAQLRIFAFIAGDEMELYRKYGLVSES